LVFANLSGALIDPKDIVGIWLFDESKGAVKEFLGKGYDGEIEGDAKRVKGKFGNALEFDGDDMVEIADDDNLRLGKAQTLTAWIYPSDNVADWVRIVGKGETGPRNYGLWRHSGGYLLFQIYGPVLCNAYDTGDNDTLGPPKEWTHMAGTYDGKDIKLFVNGAEVFSTGCTTEPLTSSDPLTFGYTGSFHTYFKGLIDDIGIFKAVLTDAEIKNIMEKGLKKIFTAVEPSGKLAISWGSIKNQ